MSKFNQYAKMVDQIVKKAADEFKAAKAAVSDAERIAEAANARRNLTADTKVEAAVADAKLQNARDNFRNVKYNMTKVADSVAGVRKDFIAAVDEEFAAKPADIDLQAMELLRSGILSERDYIQLLNSAPNGTMRKIIASYFDKWVDGNGMIEMVKANKLKRYIAVQMQDDRQKYIEAFDYLADAANRASRNAALFDKWEEIAGNLIETF